MATTIFTAGHYDPEKARMKRQIIAGIICVLVIVGGLAYLFRYWPYEHRVDRFFNALEKQDYQHAYAIWQNDPGWSQHAAQYKGYPYEDFYRDWGPGGDWGPIQSYKVEGATTPKGHSSGVIVVVTVNGRAEPARVWVEKQSKTLHFDPTS
jgi:hypothetical protein